MSIDDQVAEVFVVHDQVDAVAGRAGVIGLRQIAIGAVDGNGPMGDRVGDLVGEVLQQAFDVEIGMQERQQVQGLGLHRRWQVTDICGLAVRAGLMGLCRRGRYLKCTYFCHGFCLLSSST